MTFGLTKKKDGDDVAEALDCSYGFRVVGTWYVPFCGLIRPVVPSCPSSLSHY